MSAPCRIQLSRRKGWRMPPNTVKVDRTTRWGNPWTIRSYAAAGWQVVSPATVARYCIEAYRAWLLGVRDEGRYNVSKRLQRRASKRVRVARKGAA